MTTQDREAGPSPRAAAFEARRVGVDGVEVHALHSLGGARAGAAPVVLVHGLGMSHRYFLPTAARLAGAFEVWAPDLPGFGLSGDPGRVLDVPGLADALAAWLDVVGIERASLLGNSLGCQVALDLAARFPDRVDRLVLQGPTTPTGERNWLMQLVRWAENRRNDPPSLRPIQDRDYRDCGARRLYGTFRAGLRDRPEEKLGRVRCPALVVRGERDPICRAGWADRLARGLPDGRLVTVADAVHTMVFTSADRLVAAVEPFLAG